MLDTSEKYYYIHSESFQGPVNILLDLVQKKKIDIYDISLSEITKDFLEYVKNEKRIIMETFSSFIHIVSIMLELKAKSLIPSKNKKMDDFEDSEMSLEMLKLREKEYAVFSSAADYLDYLISREAVSLVREAPLEEKFFDMFEDIYKNIEIKEIINLAYNLFRDKPKEILNINGFIKDVTTKTISEEIERIEKILVEIKKISFKDLTMPLDKMIDKIICFLSILEMYKNGEIEITQFENFGNILIERLNE